jgi:energy-coupling factor transporter ATP-binding protein EcfA2
LVLLGGSKVGKTTILEMLSGAIIPTEGKSSYFWLCKLFRISFSNRLLSRITEIVRLSYSPRALRLLLKTKKDSELKSRRVYWKGLKISFPS